MIRSREGPDTLWRCLVSRGSGVIAKWIAASGLDAIGRVHTLRGPGWISAAGEKAQAIGLRTREFEGCWGIKGSLFLLASVQRTA